MLLAIAVAVAAATPAGAGRQPSLTRMAKDAGCVVKVFASEGFEHTTEPVVYRTNPPTSGMHDPVPAADGAYARGQEPRSEQVVHALEHGRIVLQHRDGVSRARLRSLFDERLNGERRYHQLLLRNTTNMPYAIAATAWRRLAGCKRNDARSVRVLREFRRRYVDKGPEFVP